MKKSNKIFFAGISITFIAFILIVFILLRINANDTSTPSSTIVLKSAENTIIIHKKSIGRDRIERAVF